MGKDMKTRSCLVWLASPFIFVASCMWISGPHKIWVQPEVRGTVVDQRSGLPISGAILVTVPPSFGSIRTVSAIDGSYILPALSDYEWFSMPGDPYFRTTVEARAVGYYSVRHETGHGTGAVYGGRPAPKRHIDFELSSTGEGTSKEQ